MTCYPALSVVGLRLNVIFQNIAANEERDDLKLLANAYLGHLKKAQDSNSWVPVALFHIHRAPEAKATTPGNSAVKDSARDREPTSGSSNRSAPTQSRADSVKQQDSRNDSKEADDRG